MLKTRQALTGYAEINPNGAVPEFDLRGRTILGSACATPNAYFIAAKASTTGRLLTLIMPPPG